MISRPKASLVAKWLVNDPCGTPAAWTVSPTLGAPNPCACTTRRPSVRIFSRFESLAIWLLWASMVSRQAKGSCPLSPRANHDLHAPVLPPPDLAVVEPDRPALAEPSRGDALLLDPL